MLFALSTGIVSLCAEHPYLETDLLAARVHRLSQSVQTMQLVDFS
jgi:hypothetical protein